MTSEETFYFNFKLVPENVRDSEFLESLFKIFTKKLELKNSMYIVMNINIKPNSPLIKKKIYISQRKFKNKMISKTFFLYH